MRSKKRPFSGSRHLPLITIEVKRHNMTFELRVGSGKLYPYVWDWEGKSIPFPGWCWLEHWDRMTERDKKSMALKFVRKAAGDKKAKAADVAKRDAEFGKKFPAIFEYLTATEGDDGKNRQTATLFLFLEAGEWKVCMTDRELGETCWVTAPTFQALLDALEARIQQGEGVWTKKKPQKRS